MSARTVLRYSAAAGAGWTGGRLVATWLFSVAHWLTWICGISAVVVFASAFDKFSNHHPDPEGWLLTYLLYGLLVFCISATLLWLIGRWLNRLMR